MARQLALFDPPKRAPRRVLAHMIDAGNGTADHPYAAMFECRCGWQSDWLCFATKLEIRRGVPCPTCNTTEHDAQRLDARTEAH